MGKINAELLIAAVHKRLVLWQDRHKDYKNKAVTNALWNEVGQICNCSGTAAKAKWKNLKDTFRRVLQKTPRAVTDLKGEPVKAKWLYFDIMAFVKQTISFETTQGNMQDLEQYRIADETTQGIMRDLDQNTVAEEISYSEIIKEEDDEELVFVDVNRPRTSTPSTSSSYNLPSVKRKRELTDLDAEFLAIEKERLKVQKLETLKSREDNDDIQFFRSLLPFMAKFSDLEKLEVRGEILNTILEKLKYKKIE